MKNIIVACCMLLFCYCVGKPGEVSLLHYFPKNMEELKKKGYTENPREPGAWHKKINDTHAIFHYHPNGSGFQKSLSYKFPPLELDKLLNYFSSVAPGFKKGDRDFKIKDGLGKQYRYKVALLPDEKSLYLNYSTDDFSRD